MVVRKVVTRSGGHSRGLSPSIKNPTAAAWESHGEQGFERLLELSPLVREYTVQPVREPIVVAGIPTTYIPDVKVVFIDGSTAYFEVKPAVKCLTARVASRLAAIRQRYQQTGERFYLVTAEWLEQEPRKSNVDTLMHHRRDFLLGGQERHRLARAIVSRQPRTVRDLEELVGQEKAWLLLGLSLVGVDLELPLGGSSAIFLTGGHRHANFFS